jgi:hypothetical protein
LSCGWGRRLSDFEEEFDLDRNSHGEFGHSDGNAGVAALLLAEDIN